MAKGEAIAKSVLRRFLRWVELLPHQLHRNFLNYDPKLSDAFIAFEELDYPRAFQLFLDAAEKGNSAAQCNAGILLEAGLGIKQSDDAAESWYREAAEQGNPHAQFNLASILAADLVARDQVARYEKKRLIFNPWNWLSLEAARERVAQIEERELAAGREVKAHANTGESVGGFQYGVDTLSGETMADPSERRRYVEAFKWAWVSSRKGHKPARSALRRIKRFMTSEEKREGERLARAWWNFKN